MITSVSNSVEVGKFADLVLWTPTFFGIKPDFIIKGGMVIGAKMGDTNASIPTTEPVMYRKMFGAFGSAKYDTCITFTSQAAIKENIKEKYGLKKILLPVKDCRNIGKKNMIFNDKTPKITVDPETYVVMADKEVITSQPAKVLPLAQLYNLF